MDDDPTDTPLWPTDTPVWRIMTWNLHGSAGPDLGAIAAVVRDLHPDVVALQEVMGGQARTLAGQLGWQHRWKRKHYPYSPVIWWRAEGHAILSPHHLSDVERRSVSPGVSTWTHRHRIVMAATVDRGGDQIRLYNAHLASHDAADERIAQAGRVADMAIDEGAARRSVAGDLNTHGELEVVRELHRAGMRDPGGGPTHPSIAPRRRFDYVLVPDTATVTERVELDGGDDWWELSDHLPVVVELRFAPSSDAAPSPSPSG